MKKLFYWMAAAAVVVSCAKTEGAKQDNMPGTVITIGIDNQNTKTDLTETVKVVWSAGDAISVQSLEGAFKTFTLASGAGTTSGTFSINEDVTLNTPTANCFYPATLDPKYEEGWKVTLPGDYTWSEDGIKAPMYAWLGGSWDYFKLLTSVLKLEVYNIPADADKLVFTTVGEKVCGQFTFPATPLATAATSVAAEKSISVSFDAGGATSRTFCIPVPSGDYTAGATIQLLAGSEEKVKMQAPALSIASMSVTYLPSINCGGTLPMTVWEGSKEILFEDDPWWGQFVLPLDCQIFGTVAAGSVLRLYLDKLGTETSVIKRAYQMMDDPWTWTDIDAGNVSVTAETEYVDLTLTSELLAALPSRKFFVVCGNRIRVTKAVLIQNKPERIVWKGSLNVGNWAANLDAFPAGFWDNLKAGTAITVYYDDNAPVDNSWRDIAIYAKTSGDWTSLGSGGHNADGRNVLSVVLDADQVALVKANGLALGGSGVTINKITLR